MHEYDYSLENIALEFWVEVGETPGFPRDMDDWFPLVYPIDIEKIPGLTIGKINEWAGSMGSSYRFEGERDRRLRGCLYPRRNRGTIFVDAADPIEEQRFTIAHEGGHFIWDYYLPRRRALEALGENIQAVLDGQRPSTQEERLYGVLSDVQVYVHGHLMERPDEGVPSNTVLEVEDRADRLALELLAPTASLRMRMKRRDVPAGYHARLAFLQRILYTEYGLPPTIHASYAIMLLHQWDEPTFRDWLFEQ